MLVAAVLFTLLFTLLLSTFALGVLTAVLSVAGAAEVPYAFAAGVVLLAGAVAFWSFMFMLLMLPFVELAPVAVEPVAAGAVDVESVAAGAVDGVLVVELPIDPVAFWSGLVVVAAGAVVELVEG